MDRRYSEFYKLVAENESRNDWEPMLPSLKCHILSFAPSRKQREPTTSALPGGIEVRGGRPPDGGGNSVGASGSGGDGHVVGTASTTNTTAAYGNLLEAINLALDVLETTHEEVDLASTGKSVVVLSAGTGWFVVDYKLSQVHRKRSCA